MLKKDLVQEVASTIEKWITSNKYEDQDLLPSEGEISKQLQVSRATVRDAIRILEVRGYVERIHGIGIRVNNRSTEVAINSLASMIERNDITYQELLEIRRIIEPKASYLAAKHASEEEKETLRKCVEIMEKTSPTSKQHQDNDYKFHDTIARASGNRLLYAIVTSYRSLLMKQIYEADNSAIFEEQNNYHKKIYECIENNDSEGAYRHTLFHLDETEKNLHNI